MSITNNTTQIQFLKGALKNIAQNTGEPGMPGSTITYIDLQASNDNRFQRQTMPAITEGTLFFGLKANEDTETIVLENSSYPEFKIGKNRFFLYLDDNSRRYALASPFDAEFDLSDKNIRLLNLEGALLTQATLPFLYNNINDTMTGKLTMQNTLLIDKNYSIEFNKTTETGVAGIIQACGNNGLQMGNNSHFLRLYANGQMSLDNDQVTLGYNNRTQSLDFTFT